MPPSKTVTAKDSVAQTANMRFLPPTQATLENHFENSSMMSHSEVELEKIVHKYELNLERANDELSKILKYILALLTATQSFQNGTTQEPIFKKMGEGRTDAELQKILTNIEAAFSAAEIQYKNITKDTFFKSTFSACIEYCKQCVFKRLGVLNDAKDKIYDLYQNHSLKKTLTANQVSPKV